MTTSRPFDIAAHLDAEGQDYLLDDAIASEDATANAVLYPPIWTPTPVVAQRAVATDFLAIEQWHGL